MQRSVSYLGAIALACAFWVRPSVAQIPTPPDGGSRSGTDATPAGSYSPYAERDFPSMVYWGDTHLHTSLSMDAGAFGNRLGLDAAYRFARGEQVTASGGQKARLSRPLDFLVVADHSDNMGFFPDLYAGKPNILSNATGKDWYDRIQAGGGVEVALELIGMFSQGKWPEGLEYGPDSVPYRSAWDATVKAADRYDAPGRVHRLHRLRVDLAGDGEQHAPRRRLPRRRRQGQPDGALHHPSAAGQHQSPRPVEVDGGTTRSERRVACWPSPTTEIWPTASCSRSRPRSTTGK